MGILGIGEAYAKHCEEEVCGDAKGVWGYEEEVCGDVTRRCVGMGCNVWGCEEVMCGDVKRQCARSEWPKLCCSKSK